METTFWKKTKPQIDGLSQVDSQSTNGVATKVVEENYYYHALVHLLPTAYRRLKTSSWFSKNCTGYRAVAESIEQVGQNLCRENDGLWWLPYRLLRSLCQQDEKTIPYAMYFEKSLSDEIVHLRKYKHDYDPIYATWPFSFVYWLYSTKVLGDEIKPLLDSLEKRMALLYPPNGIKEKVVYILTPDTLTIGIVKTAEDFVPGLRKRFTMEYFIAIETVKVPTMPVKETVLTKEEIMEYYLGTYEDRIESIFEKEWVLHP